jgi:alpha-beta hydrolase superfamily lysophospholipase
MGHSMGSFIVQSYLAQTDRKIDGLILSGSNYQNTLLVKAGKVVAKLEALRVGKDKPSKLLQFLSFGAFNLPFKPNRTDFDWLSKDNAEVDKYINDELCGFDVTVSLWLDMFDGLIDLYNKAAFDRIQKDLPIFIFGGDKDPVGEKGKGLPKLKQAYESVGQTNIHYKLYADGRHEMLNEQNRDEVMAEIRDWLNKQLKNVEKKAAS